MMSVLMPTKAKTGFRDCAGNCKAPCRACLVRFAQREDGSLLILGVMLFLLMAMMGGLAVDLMRYEERRTQMQQTLDRSVLAAAAINQQRDPEDVVNDYFAKAGLTQYLNSVNVTEEYQNGVDDSDGLISRNVTASAQSRIQPFFLQMMGIDGINAGAGSGAEQRVSNVEISLVLDISGSMNGSRINNLRPAAREFVTSVMGSSEPGRVSMSIVPYNAQVNIGRAMMNSFNVAAVHNQSSCVELPDWTFNSIDLSTSTSFRHNAHFDPYMYTDQQNQMLRNCPPESGNEVTALTDDVGDLHDAINAMAVDGNTSIDVGVKWGAYLLNQNANPVINNLIAANEVDSKFSNRPLDANAANTLKVLVVMTDGQNTTEYKIRDPYNTGASNIWLRNGNNRVSVYFDRPGTNDWWWPRTNTWNNARDGGNANYQQLSWPAVWNTYSVTYVAYHFYGLALNQNWQGWRDTFMESVWSQKNQRLQSICTAAKQSGVVIYGIGFEAPTDGRDQVRACSTSPSHYFDAQGLTISTAFRSIANNISQLRLTQ